MPAEGEPNPKRHKGTGYSFDPDDEESWMAHYNREGFVILRGVVDKEAQAGARVALSTLVDDIAQRVVAKGKASSIMQDELFETRLLKLCEKCPEELPNLFRKELHKKEIFDLLCGPVLLKVIRKILSTADDIRIFPNYSARPKTPFGVHDVVWHQDSGLRADGGPNESPVEERMYAFGLGSVVNCWTPLVPARVENGCMKFVPKSQNLGILPHKIARKYDAVDADGKKLKEGSAGMYAAQVDPDEMAKIVHDAIDIECDAGDVVLFSNLLVHRGGTNNSDHIRWTFDWRFQDAAKPTHRAEHGHIVWSRKDQTKVCVDGEEWAKRCLQ